MIGVNNSLTGDPMDKLDSGKGWVAVGCAFVSMFICFGVVYSFGAFFDPMSAEFNTGSSATSAVFSITTFMFFTGGIVSGMAADRFGPKPVLTFGGLAMGLGLYLTSLVNSLWVGYFTYGLGVGVGVACGYVPMLAVVGAWFERRRAAGRALSKKTRTKLIPEKRHPAMGLLNDQASPGGRLGVQEFGPGGRAAPRV